jgi:hypothetical protein
MTSGDLSADVSLLSMIFSQGLKLKDLIIQKLKILNYIMMIKS